MTDKQKTMGLWWYVDDCNMNIATANTLAGQYDSVDKESIKQQLKLIQEEVKELQQAIDENEGDAAFLKEACDVYVVLLGLLHKLELVGWNVEKALLQTTENNLTKFVSGDDVETLALTTEMYKEKGIEITTKYNEEYDMFAIVNKQTGKFLKPAGYKKADVSNCIPKWEQLELNF